MLLVVVHVCQGRGRMLLQHLRLMKPKSWVNTRVAPDHRFVTSNNWQALRSVCLRLSVWQVSERGAKWNDGSHRPATSGCTQILQSHGI